jgi:excisionase family DNA binding protein
MSTQCKTLSVPEAGKLYYGLSRNGSYDAARRGEIPVLRVGRQFRVPIAAMERLLDSVAPKPAVTP